MTPKAQMPLPTELLTRLCTAEAMRRWDNHAIQELGLPGRLLMENAATAVVEALMAVPGAPAALEGPATVVCGAGNNGGDGYAVARLLANRGMDVRVVTLGKPGPGDARENLEAWRRFGPAYPFPSPDATTALKRAEIVVDALFGTGLARPLEGKARELVEAVNASPAAIKVGVDLPSGVCSDTGGVLGAAVACTHTVTFQVPKIGLYQPPGSGLTGDIHIAPISIPVDWATGGGETYLLGHPFVRALLPVRSPTGHKGAFGHVLTLCGSAGMGGAGMLAALAALKTGAGLVTAGVPLTLRDGFLRDAPELMTLACEAGSPKVFDAAHVDFFADAATTRDALVLGCGLGGEQGTGTFVSEILPRLTGPVVIDADGLNLLAPDTLAGREAPAVLTPHPGELARLAGLTKEEVNRDRVGHARRLAAEWNVVLVLKGAGTVIAAPDGRAFINSTGDDGLASAGSGDVLAGMIGGLLAQGVAPLSAALAGVYWHGLARDCRKGEITATASTATDLIEGINEGLLNLRRD